MTELNIPFNVKCFFLNRKWKLLVCFVFNFMLRRRSLLEMFNVFNISACAKYIIRDAIGENAVISLIHVSNTLSERIATERKITRASNI